MRVTVRDFTIHTSNGSKAGVLNGTYEATPTEDQQPGWYALREVDANGNVGEAVVANVHIVGNIAT